MVAAMAIVALPTGDVHRSRPAGIGVRGGGRRARTHSMPMSRQRRRASATYRPRGRGAESRRRLALGASTRTTREHLSPDARCSLHGFSALERRRLFVARWDASSPPSGLSCDHITAAGFEGQGCRELAQIPQMCRHQQRARSIIAPCEEAPRVVRLSRRSSPRPQQPADPSHWRSSLETSAGSIMLRSRCRTPRRCWRSIALLACRYAKRRAPAAKPPCGDLCFVWDGTPASLKATLDRAGVKGVEGPVGRQGGRRKTGSSVYVRDPDGNLLEFIIYS